MSSSILDMANDHELDDHETSNLNANAPTFTPSWMAQSTTSPESHATRAPAIEEPAMVLPPNMGLAPTYYLDAYGNMYDVHGNFVDPSLQLGADGYVDAQTGFYLAQEDAMIDRLYMAPQQPKGNTYGRSRGHQGRWGRA